MTFTILLALSGLTLSSVAIYYSVIGLTAIFSAAFWPVVIMGTSLEVSKLVAASWLKANWAKIPTLMKTYMLIAVAVLMLITSMGIFGFLSKAHSDQSLVSGDVQSKIAVYDEKIKTAKENIEANRKQLKQMDEAVDQVMARSTDEKGADKANAIRRSQQRDRSALAKDIEANQKLISSLNDESAPIRAEVRKVEAEVGPIKYIAAFIYGDNPDANILEKAVTWVIMIIIFVFDPLAVLMILASQMTYVWYKREKEELAHEPAAPIYTYDNFEPPTEEEKTEWEGFDSSRLSSDSDAEGDSPEGPSIAGEPTVTEHKNPKWEFPKHANIIDYRIEDDADDEVDLAEQVGLEQWNQMIQAAEAEVEKEKSEKAARQEWKSLHPGETIKRQEKLHELGLIDKLPWDAVEAIEDAKLDTADIERPGDYLTETDDSSKKKSYMIKKQNHQIKRSTNE